MRRVATTTFISLCFLLLLGLGAQAQEYQRPKPPANGGPPTASDLSLYDGASSTLTVQLLNLTPYDIKLKGTSITQDNLTAMQDQVRTYPKSFMFLPVGIPDLIPGAPAQDFDKSTYSDTTTRPYAMVFAWDDGYYFTYDSYGHEYKVGGTVVDNWVKWTVEGVKYTVCDRTDPIKPICEYRYQDVDLGLWMYRIQPTSKFFSAYLPILSNSLKAVMKTVKLAADPANPLSWAHAFLAIKELAVGAAEFANGNSQENDGTKMWVASYVIPNPTSYCVRTDAAECSPSSFAPDESGDAVFSEWGESWAGPCTEVTPGAWTCPIDNAEKDIIVGVHLLRGQKAKQCDPNLYPNKCPLGSEPVVMITVMRAEDFAVGSLAAASPNLSLKGETPKDKIWLFLLQAGAGRIGGLIDKYGDRGLLELRSLIEGLDPAQKQVLREMIRTMGSGRLPTKQERQLVHLLADELQTQLK